MVEVCRHGVFYTCAIGDYMAAGGPPDPLGNLIWIEVDSHTYGPALIGSASKSGRIYTIDMYMPRVVRGQCIASLIRLGTFTLRPDHPITYLRANLARPELQV